MANRGLETRLEVLFQIVRSCGLADNGVVGVVWAKRTEKILLAEEDG